MLPAPRPLNNILWGLTIIIFTSTNQVRAQIPQFLNTSPTLKKQLQNMKFP